jgi:hypothetical protein
VPPVHELYTTQVNVLLLKRELSQLYTVKKRLAVFLSLDVKSLTKLSLAGNNQIILGHGDLVSDIPAGDGCSPFFTVSLDKLIHGLNIELDLQSLFGLLVHSCNHWLGPRNPSPSPRIWAHR